MSLPAALRRGLAGLAVVSLPFVQDRLDSRPQTAVREEALWAWKGEDVARLVPGFEGIVADLYWLRVVQHYGSQRAFTGGDEFPLLEPLLDVTVTLDPRMELAYSYGATFLAESPPNGAGSPEAGVALLERGIRALPESWKLRQWLGYVHFSYRSDHLAAARVLAQGSELPGAPYWLRTLAADLLARGCERRTARAVWEAMARDSGGAVAGNARLHLRVLDALDAADQLTLLVEEARRRTGQRPTSLASLARILGVRVAVQDPAGAPYDYDAASGRVTISRTSKYFRDSNRSCVAAGP